MSCASAFGAGLARQVVLVIWDGMRPDFVSAKNTPALFSLAQNGVTFSNHHSVYLSSTEVNGTAISTGSYPAHDGIIGNTEYRPAIEPLKAIHTESLAAARKGDELTRGHYVGRATIAELVQQHGGKTAVAGAKPVALLADHGARTTSAAGVNFFGGETLPSNLLAVITNRYGSFPIDSSLEPTRNDWITEVMVGSFWDEGVPTFSLIWMNQPDLAQHQSSPGSASSLAAIANADANVAKILRTLESKGARESTDIIVASDHGFSTVAYRVDLAEALTKAGLAARREFTTPPKTGEILVVSNGGSSFIYVIGHDSAKIQEVVTFLQQWEFSGVIFCRRKCKGTFPLEEVRLDSDTAPDIVVSLRWTADENKNGIPGKVCDDHGSYGVGQGSHVTLSPFDMHATLIAAGPDFKSGLVSTLASGNVDIAPTVCWILGIKPAQEMDGRILTEALSIEGPQPGGADKSNIGARANLKGYAWTQYLKFTTVGRVRYLDEGNGEQRPKR